ncbi:hypothetical protein AK812_SmicGene2019 [Symbiodinium microadriaticum]|uniref:Uncharacterized protein n=1 Tax=Symbiodinium microadriaticum TaxID=2951 RepID=A0A1Q9F2F4_SYMMI|nr:hypothetical protein AK812_SmicGene2019 [Symbiodinium microadriaticum]
MPIMCDSGVSPGVVIMTLLTGALPDIVVAILMRRVAFAHQGQLHGDLDLADIKKAVRNAVDLINLLNPMLDLVKLCIALRMAESRKRATYPELQEIYVLWGIRPVAAMRAPYKIPTVRRHSMIC